MRRPRWWACLLAKLGGFFWIQCPACGEMFAGFEASGETVNFKSDGSGMYESQCVCSKPSCRAEGKRQRAKFYAGQAEGA